MEQVPEPCKAGQYGPLPQQQSCLPCPGSTVVGSSVCVTRRRALLAADGSELGDSAGAEDALAKGDVIGMATAAGYAACTLGVLALTGMAARRTTVVQSLKQSSADGAGADASAAASDSDAVAADATAR